VCRIAFLECSFTPLSLRFYCRTRTATHTTHLHTLTHTSKPAKERARDFSVAVDAILCISMMRLFDYGIILAKPRSAFHAYKLLNYLTSDNGPVQSKGRKAGGAPGEEP